MTMFVENCRNQKKRTIWVSCAINRQTKWLGKREPMRQAQLGAGILKQKTVVAVSICTEHGEF